MFVFLLATNRSCCDVLRLVKFIVHSQSPRDDMGASQSMCALLFCFFLLSDSCLLVKKSGADMASMHQRLSEPLTGQSGTHSTQHASQGTHVVRKKKGSSVGRDAIGASLLVSFFLSGFFPFSVVLFCVFFETPRLRSQNFAESSTFELTSISVAVLRCLLPSATELS